MISSIVRVFAKCKMGMHCFVGRAIIIVAVASINSSAPDPIYLGFGALFIQSK